MSSKSKTNIVTQFNNGLFFVPLGGASEIGMNLNLYCHDDQWIIVDCGVTFRSDYGIQQVMADPQFIEEKKDKLKALVLTHAHEDHIGAVPFLWSRLRCPIYATPFTMVILKSKLHEAGLLGQVELHEVPLGGNIQIGDFGVEYVCLTHSIPESNGLYITTPRGSIFHTGDWKIDESPVIGQMFDWQKLKAIGDRGVLAMVCDSTNVFEQGNAGSEADVRASIIEMVKIQKNRVLITCFASNLARIDSCIAAAEASGRSIVFIGRSMETMLNAGILTGYFEPIKRRVTVQEAARLPKNKVMYVCSGSQGEPNAALKRIATGTYQNLNLEKDDVVLFSSRKIPGNEIRISALKNDLVRRGVNIIRGDEGVFHVSGHPCRDDLRKMYQWIRPKISIPVHGELQHLMEHARFITEECGIKNVVIPENGSVITFSPEAALLGKVHSGYLGRDGNVLVNMFGPMLKDRQRLSINGVIFISLLWQGNETLISVALNSRGVVDKEEKAGKFDASLIESVNSLFPINLVCTRDQLEEEIRLIVRRKVTQEFGTKPLIILQSHNS
jgi:ribonuclease J